MAPASKIQDQEQTCRCSSGQQARARRRCALPRSGPHDRWAEAREKIAGMTLTIKPDSNWSSFQLANSTPPLCVTDSAIAPSARMTTAPGQPELQLTLVH